MNESWLRGKQAHRALSAAAAEKYDELYEHANFATGSYMKYELAVIERHLSEAPDTSLAVDLGCGTGRDSFFLARHFQQVYAYDFSPEMIHVADRNKLKGRAGNVLFETRDIEEELLPLRDESVDFVNTAFGMGSFVHNLPALFRETRRVLKPRGLAVFSFYNAAALVNRLALEWRPALAARVVTNEPCLDVDFEGKVYRISAQAYTVKGIKHKIESNFHAVHFSTFPTLSALFPQSLFASQDARDLCSNVDAILATNIEIAAGPYIVAVGRKGGKPTKERERTGYERVLELLRFHQIAEHVKEHAPVRTMADVQEILKASSSEMVKSILVAIDTKEHPSPDDMSAELFLIGVPADRDVDLSKAALVIGKRRKELRFATQIELETITGFKVGGIPPFGMPKRVPVILDTRLAGLDHVWCGTGKTTESLRVTIADLRKLSAFSVADVSRPRG